MAKIKTKRKLTMKYIKKLWNILRVVFNEAESEVEVCECEDNVPCYFDKNGRDICFECEKPLEQT